MTAKFWQITDKGDPWALRLVDGRYANARVLRETAAPLLDLAPHYSRQQPGSDAFTRNGQNLVFISENKLAVWVTFRPTPGVATRPDGHDVWECALFRNESAEMLSSGLIREAVELTCAIWGPPPARRTFKKRVKVCRGVWAEKEFATGGIITYIKPEAVLSNIPGYCYRRAGWRHIGEASDGKPMLRAPQLDSIPDWRLWKFSGDRGGKLRKELEGSGSNGR